MDARETISDWYDQYHPEVYRYIRRRVRSSDINDVTQLTWLRAYRALDRGYVVSSPLPWLYTLARHLCIDWISPSPRSLGNLEEVVEDFSPSDEFCLREEELISVRSRLEKLRHSHREILSLRYIHNLNNKEIGEHLNASLSSVKSKIHRGLSALRRRAGVTSRVSH